MRARAAILGRMREARRDERFLRPGLVGLQSHRLDAPALHLLDRPQRLPAPERIARRSDLAEHRVHIPADRVVVAGLLDCQPES